LPTSRPDCAGYPGSGEDCLADLVRATIKRRQFMEVPRLIAAATLQSRLPGGKSCGRFGAVVWRQVLADDRVSLLVMEAELGRPLFLTTACGD